MFIEEKIKEVIMNILDINEDKIVLTALLWEDLGADSIDLVNIIVDFENEFGIRISDEEAQKLRTIQDTIDFLKARVV